MPTRYRQPKTLAMAALAALFLGSAPLHAEDEARAPEREDFPQRRRPHEPIRLPLQALGHAVRFGSRPSS